VVTSRSTAVSRLRNAWSARSRGWDLIDAYEFRCADLV
jgi:hypothetical protein